MYNKCGVNLFLMNQISLCGAYDAVTIHRSSSFQPGKSAQAGVFVSPALVECGSQALHPADWNYFLKKHQNSIS
jgi:hypothetical protein